MIRNPLRASPGCPALPGSLDCDWPTQGTFSEGIMLREDPGFDTSPPPCTQPLTTTNCTVFMHLDLIPLFFWFFNWSTVGALILYPILTTLLCFSPTLKTEEQCKYMPEQTVSISSIPILPTQTAKGGERQAGVSAPSAIKWRWLCWVIEEVLSKSNESRCMNQAVQTAWHYFS